jgi:hypothetical protein
VLLIELERRRVKMTAILTRLKCKASHLAFQ